MTRYSDVAFLEDLSVEVDREVERICVFLLDTVCKEWAAEYLQKKSPSDEAEKNYDDAVQGAMDEIISPSSGKRASPHVLYWLKVRADYWKHNHGPKSDVIVPIPDLETLLHEASVVKKMVHAALDRAKNGTDREASTVNTEVPTQQLVLLDAVSAIGDAHKKNKEAAKARAHNRQGAPPVLQQGPQSAEPHGAPPVELQGPPPAEPHGPRATRR